LGRGQRPRKDNYNEFQFVVLSWGKGEKGTPVRGMWPAGRYNLKGEEKKA